MPLLTHNELKITERRIAIPRLAPAFEGFRIVQLSDLHFYEHTDRAYYDRVIEEVGRLQADLAVLTGDIIHYGDGHLDLAQGYLTQVTAPAGKLAILGNHDYHDGAWSQNICRILSESGFQLLCNESVSIRRGEGRLWVVGLDDLWYGTPDLTMALANVPSADEATIALAHNPLLFDPIALGAHQGRVDLVISGHTHAGHVYIPILGPIYRKIFRMKYRYGLFEKNGCRLHVTSGVGSAAFYLKRNRIGFPRFRFNTHPEIAVLTLTRQA